uniref:Uncharacterized protein n=1 Tax=Glossina pallidipes TaxID=7398 RepID=A0A1B0AJA7_GLOPL
MALRLQELINTNDFKKTLAHDNGSDHVLIVTYHVVIIHCSLSRNSCLLSLYNTSGVMYAIPKKFSLHHAGRPYWFVNSLSPVDLYTSHKYPMSPERFPARNQLLLHFQ